MDLPATLPVNGSTYNYNLSYTAPPITRTTSAPPAVPIQEHRQPDGLPILRGAGGPSGI